MKKESKIKIGVIGAGRWGPNLIRNFHSSQHSEVVAVADSDASRLKMIADRYPDLAVTESAEIILQDPIIDAVAICTPTSTHFELTRAALENKKHVFVEKPLAQNQQECADLISIARKEKRLLFVGHVFVYNAGIQAVKKYLDSGELGKIHYVQITRTNLGPVRTDVNALWDLGSHDLSILNYWLKDYPIKVSAIGGNFLNEKNADSVFATYTYPNNVLANLHVSWLNPKKIREAVLVCENKMLTWDDMDLTNPIRIYDKKVVVDRSAQSIVDTFASYRTSIHEGDTLIPRIQMNEPLVAECNAFLKAIRDPKTSLSPGEEGMKVVQALEAADDSLKNGGLQVPIRYV